MRVQPSILHKAAIMLLTAKETDARREAKPLVDKLESMKGNWPSEPSLRDLNPGMIDALITYIETDVKLAASFCWMSLIPLSLMLPFALRGSVAIVCLTAAFIVFWYVCFSFSVKTMPQSAVHALTQTEDLRVLPVLILESRHSGAQNVYVYNAIFRLLNQVTEEHAGLLNNDAQQHLWKLMMTRHLVTEYSDRDVTMRTLHALAAIGNRATLARMKRFAWPSRYPNIDVWLIDEARNLIPIMEARLERQQVPETLLRAAGGPVSAPDTLLRPTVAAAPEAAEQLLRASRSEGD